MQRFSRILVIWNSQGSGKIPHTCNLLIFLRVVILNSLGGGFFLVRGFPHLSTDYHVNLFSTTLSLFGDLLVLWTTKFLVRNKSNE